MDRRRQSRPKEPEPTERERITLLLHRSLIERLRNAVYWTAGLTLAGLVAKSLDSVLRQMESERGAPFPKRESELKIGRPAK